MRGRDGLRKGERESIYFASMDLGTDGYTLERDLIFPSHALFDSGSNSFKKVVTLGRASIHKHPSEGPWFVFKQFKQVWT